MLIYRVATLVTGDGNELVSLSELAMPYPRSVGHDGQAGVVVLVL